MVCGGAACAANCTHPYPPSNHPSLRNRDMLPTNINLSTARNPTIPPPQILWALKRLGYRNAPLEEALGTVIPDVPALLGST